MADYITECPKCNEHGARVNIDHSINTDTDGRNFILQFEFIINCNKPFCQYSGKALEYAPLRE